MKKFKGFISLLLALVMLSALTPSAALGAAATSGTCGDNLTYECIGEFPTRKLVISGTGPMEEFATPTTENVPWDSIKYSFHTLIVNEGVTTIGRIAFYKACFWEAYLPSTLVSIGEKAFYNNQYLASVDFSDGLKTIGDWAFYKSSLKELYLPESVTSIGANAFEWNDFTNVVLPDGITNIGDYAFCLCKSLKSITLPDSLKVINKELLSDCYSLESIDIPGNVTTIMEGAFGNCTSLESVSIPLGVTKIGEDAFSGCTNLEDVYYAGSKSDRNKISIGNGNSCLKNATWHYNSEKAAQGGSGAADVYYTVTFDSCGVADVAPQTVAQFATATEPTVDMSRESYTFLGWYNGSVKYDFNATAVTGDLKLTAKWEDEEKVLTDDDGKYYMNTNKFHLIPVGQEVTYTRSKEWAWSPSEGLNATPGGRRCTVSADTAGKYKLTLTYFNGLKMQWDLNRLEYVPTPSYDYAYIFIHAFNPLTNITAESQISMNVGELRALNYSTTPSGNYARSASGFYWTSSDTNVVKIDDVGILTAVGTGTATITLGCEIPNVPAATCTVTVTAGSSTQSSSGISVTLNGSKLTFDQQPTIIDGRTMVPLRAIFEALGASVDWNSSTQTVTAKKGSTTVKMTIGQKTMYVNNTAKTLDVAPQLVNNRTLVPARAVAESFGCSVTWDDTTKTVVITN